jgi:hypothetical protein
VIASAFLFYKKCREWGKYSEEYGTFPIICSIITIVSISRNFSPSYKKRRKAQEQLEVSPGLPCGIALSWTYRAGFIGLWAPPTRQR